MALISNTLQRQVDLPVWEWLRSLPVAATAGLSATCVADCTNFHPTSGRYQYALLNATNFWRYDTVSDTYQQLASPPNPPVTASSIRFTGAQGYANNVISGTSTTINTFIPTSRAAVGYKIRIVSGRGAGQERIITDVSEPIVVDSGSATAGSTISLTDTNKSWLFSYTGTTGNVNNFVGYGVRLLFGTGLNQARKILYNSATVLTIGDLNFIQNDMFATAVWTAPAAGTSYQIEYNTVTVDTAWTITPDNTSRFVIQSGAIWLISGAAAAPFFTMQYYDVLHDLWYIKTTNTQVIPAAPTEVSLERITENSSLWFQGVATSGTTSTIVDSMQNWKTNQWAGYDVYVYSGTGLGQVSSITSNTSTTLTLATTLSTSLASGSKYQILGYNTDISTGSNSFDTINDSNNNWTVNRWVNYAVRILHGTGAGQVRTIRANTSTQLSVYKPWNIIPNNTSVFSIQGDSDNMYIAWGGLGQIFTYNTRSELMLNARSIDDGVTCVGAALLCDSSHNVYERPPIALTSLAGTTTITATTVQAHNLITGQWVSIRGVTNGTDQHNVTGLVQITSVPSTTTFTYAPSATGSGTYTFGLTALATTALTDATKEYRDNLSSANTTSLTFSRATPSNINGWYVSGTNITPGTRISSGAGTTTLTLSATQGATPSGIMIISAWGPSTNFTATGSGGGAGVATITLSSAAPAASNGWSITGTGITPNTYVFSGQGTTSLVLTNACSGAVSGTITIVPPTVAGKMITYNSTTFAGSTGFAVSQTAFVSSSNGTTATFIAAAAAAPVAAVSKYNVTPINILGSGIESQNISYYGGVLLGTQSTTTAVDTNSFWATATGSAASAGLTTITLSAVSPGSVNGWFITGTGINAGAYIVSGAGTNTITISQPTSGAVSGTMTCTAWNGSLIGRRLKFLSSTGIGQDVAITGVTQTTGTLTFGIATAGAASATAYSICSIPVHGPGCEIIWVSSNTSTLTRGKYLWIPRCGGSAAFDKLDITTDRIINVFTTPFTETLTTGSYFAYDQLNRIYFTKDATLRFYYIDLETHTIHGAGLAPFISGTAQIGNKMDIFVTADNLYYLIFNRHGGQEVYRQLLFY